VYLSFLFPMYRKVKHRDSTGAESQPRVEEVSEVCKQEDDHVFVKPAEPKVVEPKERVSIDSIQSKDKLVSILFHFRYMMFS